MVKFKLRLKSTYVIHINNRNYGSLQLTIVGYLLFLYILQCQVLNKCLDGGYFLFVYFVDTTNQSWIFENGI